MKKVTHSLFVPMDAGKEAFCAGRVVSKDTVSTFTHAQIYAIMERELFVYQFLGNFRGIWPLLSWCRYEKTKERVTFPKLSLILKLADSDLEGFSFSHSKLDRFLGYMEDLAYGLWYMHEKGFVHIDAKATNALVGGDCAGWIDFGHCFRPKEEPLPEKNPLRLGFYGTNIYTAYELLGKRGFSGDYTKLDVWAFGCMFYGILKGTFLPWTNLLLPLEPHSVVSCELREKMKEEITKTIERPLGRLQQKNPQTLQIPDLLELLVYNMLRLDPNVRWSMKEVVEQIAIIRRLIR